MCYINSVITRERFVNTFCENFSIIRRYNLIKAKVFHISADIKYKRQCTHCRKPIIRKGKTDMEIAKVAEQAAVTAQTVPKTSVQTTAEKTNSTLATDNADKYVKSEETFTPAYTKKSAQKKEVDNTDKSQFRTVAQSKADHLASVVETLISHQASNADSKSAKKIELSDDLKSQIEEATGKKTESDETSTEDYWGAEATAKRMFEFAKNLAGNDSKYAEKLKDAFIKGFGLAEKAYGGKGKLPQVCYDTYDKVIDMFDSWSKEKVDDATDKADSKDTVKVEEGKKSEASAQ